MSFAPGSTSRSSDASSRLSRLPVKVQRLSNRSQSVSRPQKTSLDKANVRSRSTLGEQLRLSRQRSGSMLKQTTPVTHNILRSTRKSPLISSTKKDNRPITDKRWQYEQLVKVRNFVASYVPEIDHNNIKSGMSLDTFVVLMGMLFQMIDKRLVVTKENYIEEIPARLKLFNYCTTIKPSLMKTVNTPHSWSSVIAIISWLTDIIYKINVVEDHPNKLFSLVDNCIRPMFYSWIEERDSWCISDQSSKEMDAKLVELFNIDEDALQRGEDEITHLTATIQEYVKRNKSEIEEIEVTRAKIDSITSKHNDYITANTKFEQEIKDKQALIIKNIKKLDEELENFYVVENTMKATIANQPHSLANVQSLMGDIEMLRNTLKLKEDRQQQQTDLIHTFDHQLTDLSQKLQADTYSYNNIVSELELAEPSWKGLHVRETGFLQSDMNEEFCRVQALVTTKNKSRQNGAKMVEVQICDLSEKYKLISEQEVYVNDELEKLMKANAELELSIEHKSMKEIVEQQSAQDHLHTLRSELLELKANRPKIQDLELVLHNENQEYNNACEFLRESQSRALEFFVTLDAQITNSIKEYLKIMKGVTENMISTQHKLIDDSKARVEICQNADKDFESLMEKKKEN